MSASLSASVTRILALSGFPSELKTKDIQAAFTEWENERGGFKIKWIDDTGLLLVFADPGTAKRAYLQTIHSPPTAFTSPTSATIFQIKPYDGPDAQIVIHTVNSRRGNNARQGSISVSSSGSNLGIPAVQAHGRNPSVPATQGKGDTGSIGRNGWKNGNGSNGSINPLNVNNNALGFVGREPSPTLPNIPAHPTLNSLINSTLSEMSPQSSSDAPSLPSLSPPAPSVPIVPDERGTPPKIGDPAKRMVGHALGVKHPGIAPRASGGNNDLQKAMSGLTIAE